MKRTYFKRGIAAVLCAVLTAALLMGCGSASSPAAESGGTAAAEDSAAEETGNEASETSGKTQQDPGASHVAEETEKLQAEASESAGSQSSPAETDDGQPEGEQAADNEEKSSLSDAPKLPGLTCTGRMAPEYAITFEVWYYEDGYALIDVFGDSRYLLIPEDGEAPEGLPEDITCLKRPFERIYMAATAVYSHFYALGEMDLIRFTSTQKGSIFLSEVDERIDAGTMIFAGKYSTPDYETLLEGECDLAVENTGINHVPEVKEMIEELQIPVFVDRSSYENHPLGRTEWIRIYGLLTGKEEEADRFFEEQKTKLMETAAAEPTGKTVIFFYMTGDGMPVIRQPDDYIVRMIELAGGKYAFADFQLDTDSPAPRISMEEFYAAGKDADVILYNATMESPLTSVEELLDMNELFADFKAVQDGAVWAAGEALFQRADICAEFTGDISAILHEENDADLQFLNKVE